MNKIIDSHIHCSDSSGDDLLIPYAEINHLKYNLRGFLLSPPIRGNVPLPNEKIIEQCERSEGKLCPILTVEPSRNAVSDAITLAKAYKSEVRGFKIRLGYVECFASDEVFDPLYDFAESENLPV